MDLVPSETGSSYQCWQWMPSTMEPVRKAVLHREYYGGEACLPLYILYMLAVAILEK